MLDSLENIRIKLVIFFNQVNVLHRLVLIVLLCIEILGYKVNVNCGLPDS